MKTTKNRSFYSIQKQVLARLTAGEQDTVLCQCYAARQDPCFIISLVVVADISAQEAAISTNKGSFLRSWTPIFPSIELFEWIYPSVDVTKISGVKQLKTPRTASTEQEGCCHSLSRIWKEFFLKYFNHISREILPRYIKTLLLLLFLFHCRARKFFFLEIKTHTTGRRKYHPCPFSLEIFIKKEGR